MNFLEKIRRFMYGRYGFDQFGRFLFILSMVFWALCFVLRFIPLRRVYVLYSVCSFLNTAIYVYAFFRILSRNTYKRSVENERYLRFRNKVIPLLDKKTANIRDKNYVYRKCPKCGAKLRLKRIKGKHTTKCPKCGAKFNVRVFIEYKNNYTEPGEYYGFR